MIRIVSSEIEETNDNVREIPKKNRQQKQVRQLWLIPQLAAYRF